MKQKEQRAGSHMFSFLFSCPYRIPSIGCCKLLVGKTLEAGFLDSEIVADRAGSWDNISKLNLMRQSVLSPGRLHLSFIRSLWGLTSFVWWEHWGLTSQGNLSKITQIASGRVGTSISHRLIQNFCSKTIIQIATTSSCKCDSKPSLKK